ncbi:MAG: hypothetical protein QOJ50_177 [Cryptosporangiaceae bacterium]|nr:hypothetical protein [Cryptosporangiaceae bacterium]
MDGVSAEPEHFTVSRVTGAQILLAVGPPRPGARAKEKQSLTATDSPVDRPRRGERASGSCIASCE